MDKREQLINILGNIIINASKPINNKFFINLPKEFSELVEEYKNSEGTYDICGSNWTINFKED